MPLDPEQLKALGITEDWQVQAFAFAYPINCRSAIKERELAELVALKQIAEQEDLALLAQMGLAPANVDNPHAVEWRRYTNDCKVTTQIAEDANASAGFTYDGREIQTFLQGSISNMSFNPHDIQHTFDAIYAAAESIAIEVNGADSGIINAVQQIREEFTKGYKMPSQVPTALPKLPKTNTSTEQEGSFPEPEEDEGQSVDDEFIAEMATFTNQSFSADGVEHLKTSFESALDLPDRRLVLRKILARNIRLERVFIGRLAIALWRAENNVQFPQLPDGVVYREYVKRIQERDIDIQSHKKRPILRVMYRQYVEGEPDNQARYCKVLMIPNSDISSAQRSPEKMQENMMLSNDWTVIVQPIILTHEGKKIDFDYGEEVSFGRSSSVAVIHSAENKAEQIGKEPITDIVGKEGLNDLEIIYASFCALVRHYAKEELIKQINSGQNVDRIFRENNYIIQEGYITALSPLISEERGLRYTSFLGKAITSKTVYENEAAQLATTQYCLERIARDKSLKFTLTEAAEILRRTTAARNDDAASHVLHELTIERLTDKELGMRITHENYYSNYMVNKVAGVRVESLDVFNVNKSYFVTGNIRRKERIVEFINSHVMDDTLKAELINIFMPLNYLHRDALISKKLLNFRQEHQHELSDDIIKFINLYIDIETYYDVAKIRKQIGQASAAMVSRVVAKARVAFGTEVDPLEQRELERIAASYITARKEQKLCALLGIRAHVTCKSGVDRTGLYQAFVEAFSAIDIDTLILHEKPEDRMPDMEQLEENILRSLTHSLHTTVKRENLAGIAGVQIDPPTLKTMPQVSNFLYENMSGAIGSSGKEMYKLDKACIAQVIMSDASAGAHLAMTRTSTTTTSPRAMVYSPPSYLPKPSTPKSTLPPTSSRTVQFKKLPPIPTSGVQLKKTPDKAPTAADNAYARQLHEARTALKKTNPSTPTTTASTTKRPARPPRPKQKLNQDDNASNSGDNRSDT
ncbi:MAG TPA: hypothetical protein VLG38_04540 [Gammaproteobacteria bacterium]|nr:hypothetical protein [Gammaproteobacteria bacterium]